MLAFAMAPLGHGGCRQFCEPWFGVYTTKADCEGTLGKGGGAADGSGPNALFFGALKEVCVSSEFNFDTVIGGANIANDAGMAIDELGIVGEAFCFVSDCKKDPVTGHVVGLQGHRAADESSYEIFDDPPLDAFNYVDGGTQRVPVCIVAEKNRCFELALARVAKKSWPGPLVLASVARPPQLRQPASAGALPAQQPHGGSLRDVCRPGVGRLPRPVGHPHG